MFKRTSSRPLATVLFRREALFFLLTLVCALIFFMFSLRLILATMWDRAVHNVRLEFEKEADTIARLLVFEFSHLQELENQINPDQAVEERIKRLLWEKVTFNETIRGIELISRQADDSGQHLIYSFFPHSQRESESERGPQVSRRSFTGPEGDLIRILNREQRVDRTILESINQGRKLESEMLLRYFPQYIPLPDRGAVYWGVTKVGINVDAMRRFLLLLEDEKDRLRQILLGVMAGVTVISLTLGLLGLRWLGRKTAAPLENYGVMASALEQGAGLDLPSLLAHLNRQDSQNIREFEQLQAFSRRLGNSLNLLAERLMETEWQACAGRLAAKVVAAHPDPRGRPAALTAWAGLFAPRPTDWGPVVLEPFLQQLSSFLAATATPAREERQPLPPVYGCEATLVQAVVLLWDFTLHQLQDQSEVTWLVLPLDVDKIIMEIQFPGQTYRQADIARLLQPLQTGISPLPLLGPFLAAGIARQHGGELSVLARPGGGLRLHLSLPAAVGRGPGEATDET